MNATMTDRPRATWLEVPVPDGGTRLEMRWHLHDHPVVATPASAATHAA